MPFEIVKSPLAESANISVSFAIGFRHPTFPTVSLHPKETAPWLPPADALVNHLDSPVLPATSRAGTGLPAATAIVSPAETVCHWPAEFNISTDSSAFRHFAGQAPLYEAFPTHCLTSREVVAEHAVCTPTRCPGPAAAAYALTASLYIFQSPAAASRSTVIHFE